MESMRADNRSNAQAIALEPGEEFVYSDKAIMEVRWKTMRAVPSEKKNNYTESRRCCAMILSA